MTDTPEVLMKLSLARTSLDDPGGLPEEEHQIWLSGDGHEYAINRIDDVMRALDTDEHPVLALRTICELIAGVSGTDSPDDDDPENLIRIMQGAVEDLWRVAGRLEEGGLE